MAHLLAKKTLKRSNSNKLCIYITPRELVVNAYNKDLEGFPSVKYISNTLSTRLAALSNKNALRGIGNAHRDSSIICNASVLDV